MWYHQERPDKRLLPTALPAAAEAGLVRQNAWYSGLYEVTSMFIDTMVPQIVGDRTSLRHGLLSQYAAEGVPAAEASAILDAVPVRLVNGECFYDRLTNRWRYEYAPPLEIDGLILHGAVNCPEVRALARVLRFCVSRLTETARRRHLARLAEPSSHLDSLAEFLPVVRLPDAVAVVSEHRTGAGGRDVDWLIQTPLGRTVLLEVKSRLADLAHLVKDVKAGQYGDSDVVGPAQHNAAILFRSVEEKFLPALPVSQLQGVWISTTIAQPPESLAVAFNALAHDRVHFAIFGDWNPGILVLSRADADRDFVLSLFGEHEGPGWLNTRVPFGSMAR